MQLNLTNPLLFFDLESTGLDVAKDRIVEISCVKVYPDGHEEVKTRRINPTIPIPPEATAIHHITNDDVKDCPTFKQVAKSLAQWIGKSDIAGYNSLKYDIPLLNEEFLRAEISFDFRKRHLLDVQNIFHKMEQRTLIAAYKFYCNKDLTAAHSAEGDTEATYEVLKAQLDRYPNDLKNDVSFLANFSTKTKNADYAGRIIYNDKDQPIFNFGKHKGKLVTDILKSEPSYYDWMMNGDFTRDTKKVLTAIKLSMR
ncbi:MAG: 3'-5' exonuclease [Bacteroidales bacterium]|jgi:DNA polymerase-3 subunit epsilon|nr:3'-5' exonuclease [Bacteroidales bacterium]MCI2121211.1 3'-5' exonuclease [Bacteroidales bacterium]MCI2145999.1 3'-5' exonuclease [Bacteroidales bacterium]